MLSGFAGLISQWSLAGDTALSWPPFSNRIKAECSSVTAAKPQVVVVVWIWSAGPQRVMEDCG